MRPDRANRMQKSRLLKALTAFAAAACAGALAAPGVSIASAATPAATDSANSIAAGVGPAPTGHLLAVTTDHTPPAGAMVGEWGITKAGQRYSYTYRVGDNKPAAAPVQAAVVTGCSEYISNLQLLGAGASAYFQWETSQTCVGAYGTQSLRTQLWRSSWSGPRGYDSWSSWTKPSGNSIIDWGWSADCSDGGGTYVYYPVMQGKATGVGQGPTLRSQNSLKENCGPNAP